MSIAEATGTSHMLFVSHYIMIHAALCYYYAQLNQSLNKRINKLNNQSEHLVHSVSRGS